MAESVDYEIQKALYSKLTGNAALMSAINGVYDRPAQGYDDFPYVTIGEMVSVDFSGGECVGYDTTVTIHVWSRTDDRGETKQIQGLITGVLNRADLSFTDYSQIDCLKIDSTTMLDPDGETWHGVQTFNITTEEA